MDKDSTRLWKLVKAMNDETNTNAPIVHTGAPIVLQHEEELLSRKKEADHFINQSAQTSYLQVRPGRWEEVRKAEQALQDPSVECLMNTPFSLQSSGA